MLGKTLLPSRILRNLLSLHCVVLQGRRAWPQWSCIVKAKQTHENKNNKNSPELLGKHHRFPQKNEEFSFDMKVVKSLDPPFQFVSARLVALDQKFVNLFRPKCTKIDLQTRNRKKCSALRVTIILERQNFNQRTSREHRGRGVIFL